jgi:hypothetical protein
MMPLLDEVQQQLPTAVPILRPTLGGIVQRPGNLVSLSDQVSRPGSRHAGGVSPNTR